jgi:trans-aconitate 2-methyltransferase
VPDNDDAPSQQRLRELATSPAWASRLSGAVESRMRVHPPGEYLELLLAAGWRADVWSTTYQQLLTGPDPVVDWMRGTSLRPVLQALPAGDVDTFVAEYAELMRQSYPPGAFGTLFPFRRTFVVGHRP